jgi:hypothetical protein
MTRSRRRAARRRSNLDRTRKHCPRGYMYADACRDKAQARAFRREYTGQYTRPVIVQTGPNRGKKRHVFPYHIAVKRSEFHSGGRSR